MRRVFKAINLGIITAVLGALVYFFAFGYELEENFGLDVLFKVRGSIATPDDSVVIAINKMSSDYFGLENEPAKWPRHYHAKLIDILKARGAKVIAFDVFFKDARDKQGDEKLATAIKNAGNVILFSQLKRQILSQQGRSPQFLELNNAINIEQLVYPTPVIAQASAVLAPFALLKYPQKVSKFWTFRVPAGEIPNLPVMAFQLANMENYLSLRKIIQEIIPGKASHLPANINDIVQKQQLTEVVSELRRLFKEDPSLAKKLKQAVHKNSDINTSSKASLTSLINMYQGPNQYYLNFYGPPRSITTIPYHEVIADDSKLTFDFTGKVVFVGFSEYLQPEQKDNFYTVFSQSNGLDISGVEIAATAFSNLVNNQSIKTLNPFTYVTLIAVFGFIIAFASRYFHTIPSVFVAISIVMGYALFVYVSFREYDQWLPWVVPLLIQSPFAIFVALLCHYADTRREREQIRKAFGYYLPTNVVTKIAQNAGHIEAQQQQMYGICLATDAAKYTTLAENMPPAELSQLVNHYYENLFSPVRHYGGIISDVVGDSMLAIWSSPLSDVQLRTQACKAALEIDRVMNKQTENREAYLLPTRIGLHAGELMLGNVGAMDHYEYRAVGDIVNTSNRIESLNKQIGSNVIASENVIEGVQGIIMRSLGKFRLAGKQQALELYELLCRDNDVECDKTHIQIKERCEMLTIGITAFQAQDWQRARTQFSELKRKYSNDKAADFYLQYCDLLHERTLPIDWEGIIELSEK
ncbi:MAG: adenylate/guanylate cyclase domain-containing protein [Gammaproteobacteria bacterium]|nr:adenylate/guanylate cyclase domain-containing protein [Gammaproteobacteria bacterium]MCW8987394.1 adenylate/guanylate cyclase domain-containing protein [Gammaproteobacteria bacterium]